MTLLSLNLHERAPVYPLIKPLPPRPFELKSADLNKGVPPYRGLLYSFLVHEAGLFSLLLLPIVAAQFQQPPLLTDPSFVIDMSSRARLVYFPTLHSDPEGKAKDKELQPNDAPKPAGQRTQGLSYPGRQPIVSDVPDATNRFQTLLQPALIHPPTLNPPVPLPNLIQTADAGPLPVPLPPPPSPTAVQKDLTIPAPSQAAAQRANVLVPNSPQAALPAPERFIDPPTSVQKQLTVSPPKFAASQRPKLVLPAATDSPEVPVPEKPIELTALQKDLAIPAPARAAAGPKGDIALLKADASPELPKPERPREPPTLARKDLTISSPSQTASQRPSVVVPGPTSPSAAIAPPRLAPIETHGGDAQNVISITPLPAPQQTAAIPAAEARGRFAISPESDLRTTSVGPGAKADEVPAVAAGVGKTANGGANAAAGAGARGGAKPDAPNSGKGANGGAASAGGTGDGARGRGTGAAAPNNGFPGITIQGGRLENGTGIIDSGRGTRAVTLGAPPRPPAAGPNPTYGMTVVSKAGSGGGLPDLGVFVNEQVYTVYLDMKYPNGAAAPSWPLQYAVIPASANPSNLTPPFPMMKMMPSFSPETVQKYPRKFIVVYATIGADGRPQQLSVKQTPDPQLNAIALTALSKWTFRPAEIDGRPVSVKTLIGIPLAPSE